jgi:hypothetical protein
MDEEITIIDTKTRNERIINFFIENKKILISIFIFLILISFSFYFYQVYKDGHKKELANEYNSAVIEYENGSKSKVISSIKAIIENKDSTYSPLGLYFLLDNNLIENRDDVNNLFDILIKETKLEPEIKNLIVYKKVLYNIEYVTEIELIKMIKPIINSESIWKSHTLYLMAEYFYSINEKQKSKEFYEKILILSNSNQDIRLEAQKRLNRDLSE